MPLAASTKRTSAFARTDSTAERAGKLIEFASGETFLFDLIADPAETRDLFVADPASAETIAATLRGLVPQ